MGKQSEKSPSSDYFRRLFGNITKGGLGLFLNNPFQRKPESDSQQTTDVGVTGTSDHGETKHKAKKGQSLEAEAREVKDDENDKHLGQARRKAEAVGEGNENSGEGKRKTKVIKDNDENLQDGTKKIKVDSKNDLELDPSKNKKKADSESHESVPRQKKKKPESEIQETGIHDGDSSEKTKKKKKERMLSEERSAGEEILGSSGDKKANLSDKIEAKEYEKDSTRKEKKRRDDATEEFVQTKEEKKKKKKEDATEDLVQRKEEKKKRVLDKNRKPKEADVDEVREMPGRRQGKRIIEQEDINGPNKKRKISRLNSQDFEDGLGKGLTVGSGERGDPKRKSELRKRKRDVVEEEYAVRHGLQVDETLSREGAISKKTIGKRKRGADEEDMVVKKEAFDDGEKLHRTIFVGNLPLSLKRKQLIKEFSQFGEVESVRLRSVPILDSKLPRKNAILKGEIDESLNRVHAYVVFKDEQSANAALSHNLEELGGNHIRVDRAYPPCKKLKGENHLAYDYKRTVFVGNLPFDVKDEELYRLFIGTKALESSVEAVRVIRDPHTSKGKGIAYVLFNTVDAAKLAVKKNHFKLRDRDLRLCKARPDSHQGSRAVSTLGAQSDMNLRTDGSSGKRPAESGLSNLSAKKKRISLSYQGMKASKTDGRPVKVTGATSIQKDKKSDSVHANDTQSRQSKRPAVAARKAGLSKSPGPNHAGKKRKQVEVRTGYSKSPKKVRAH